MEDKIERLQDLIQIERDVIEDIFDLLQELKVIMEGEK